MASSLWSDLRHHEGKIAGTHLLNVTVGDGRFVLTPLRGIITHHLQEVLPPVVNHIAGQFCWDITLNMMMMMLLENTRVFPRKMAI